MRAVTYRIIATINMDYLISKTGEKLPIEKVKVLIAVKTYPLPSKEYQETVCTAGVREDGTWIRLYPVPYRHLPYDQWYKKYHWIELEVIKHDKDPRSESYRPYGEIKILGKIDTKNNWAERKRYALKHIEPSLEALKEKSKRGVSLGVIKPKEVLDFIVEPVSGEWKDKWQSLFKQLKLFGEQQKSLEKIPYKFSYRFICHGEKCASHKIMIEDWEIYALYSNMLKEYGSKEKAIEKVKEQYFLKFTKEKDLYFFMGTTRKDHHRGAFLIIGVFYPKKEI